MFSQKCRWVSLALATLGCGLSLRSTEALGDDAAGSVELTAALKLAGAPIPQSAGGHNTERDYRQKYLDWQKRIILPPLQAAAKGQPWEATALKFVEDALVAVNGLESGDRAQAWTELASRGDALVKGGCEEPTVLFYATRFKVKPRNRGEISPLYRRALELLEADPRYRKAFAGIVAVNLSAMLQSPSAALNQKILELRRAGFEEGSYAGADDAFFVDQVLNESDPLRSNLDEAEKLATGLKGLAEWARDTILGNIEIARGWNARGHGYANDVTEEHAREYGEWLEKARNHLEAAWKLRPDYPHAASDMIQIAMDSGPGSAERTRLWFDRTVKARFDASHAYSTYMNSLLPRWGGSYQQMLAFGIACAATKRFDTETPREFMKAVSDISRDTHRGRDIYEIPQIAGTIIAVDHGYLTAAEFPADKTALTSNLALDAWLGEQWSDAKKALDQLPDRKFSPNTMARISFFGTDAQSVVGEILVNSSAAKEDYAKARALEKQERYEEASVRYAAVMKAVGNEPAVKDLIDSATKVDSARKALANGEWKDITPKAADTSAWTLPRTARWSAPEDGILEAGGTGETTMSLWNTPVGENYEIRGTFEFLPPLRGDHRVAVVLGRAARHPEQAIFLHFSTAQALPKGMVRLLWGTDVIRGSDFDVQLPAKNHFLIQCWRGSLSLHLNDKLVFEKLKPSEGTPSDHEGQIGFGAYKMPQGESFRISEIAVRVLKAEPPLSEDVTK